MIPAWSPLWPECMFPINIKKKGAWVLISLIQEPMTLRRLELSRNARRESVVWRDWRLQTTAVTTCCSPWFIRSSDSISAALWRLVYLPPHAQKASGEEGGLLFRTAAWFSSPFGGGGLWTVERRVTLRLHTNSCYQVSRALLTYFI